VQKMIELFSEYSDEKVIQEWANIIYEVEKF
jgi:hypothetical protein